MPQLNDELKTKSIIIPNQKPHHSNIEEMMQTTAAQIRDLKSGATSQNVTESVPVPSSEHVAEIVGRQGCKIKALRAKTNTYIKTPVRGEAPMFVITGRKEDVHTAKREIQLAADHFSQIRARRGGANGSDVIENQLSSSSGSSSSISISPPNISNMSQYSMNRSSSNSPSILIKPIEEDEQVAAQLQPGQIVKKVTVPYQVVGLVVGPKGSTIKRIQQNTNTYIVTPSRDSQPVFEIQGLPDNVESAKIEIENYIMLRTSTTQSANNTQLNDFSKPLEFDFYNNVIDIIDDLKIISPNSSSLFKSVAAVVDDDYPNSQSNIWSSPPQSSSSSIASNTDEAKLDHRSSISSTSSDEAAPNIPLFIYDSKLNDLSNNSFDFGTNIMSAFNMNDKLASNFASLLPNTTSLSSSISSSNSNDQALNSLFQQHESLLLTSTDLSFMQPNIAAVTSDFNFLNLNQQQSQYYY